MKIREVASTLGIYRLAKAFQRGASQSPAAVSAAVLIRNQCNMIINYRFALSPQFEDTGEAWLVATVAPSAKTFVDVGANRGDWTAAALACGRDGKRFLAFEPGRAVHRQLVESFADVSEFTVIEAAVSSVAGRATFYEHTDTWASTLAADFDDGPVEQRIVDVVTLDDQLPRLGYECVDFLKIDTEGYDLHVIEGGKRLLMAQCFGVVQFEYNDHWRFAGSTLSAAYAIFREAGYQVFMLRHDGLYDFNYAKYREFFGFANFVAVSPRFAPSLQPFVKGAV